MPTTTAYEHLVSEIEDYHARKVARILSGHVGQANAVTKDSIARQVFGGGDEHNTSDAATRKVRVIVSQLRERGLPVCANSGAAGYYLPANTAEAEPVLAEMRSRIAHLSQAVQAIEKALKGVQQPELF